MTFTVKVLPSGREFIVPKGETVLDAGLSAGLNLKYNCSSGSCGDCRARLVSGELGETGFHDFFISEEDQQAGYFLPCRSQAASDLVIEASEARGAEDIPVQEITTRVSRLELINDDVMVIHLRTPRSDTLRFLAGQHVTLLPEGLAPRNKSVASCPCNGMQLQLHVQRNPDDPFSAFVFDGMGKLKSLALRGPWGNFTLDEESRRPLLFIAWETGFAPIKSLIEHTIALELEQPVQVFWVSRREGGHYMANYCRSWADAMEDFRFTPIVVGEGAISEHSMDAALAEVAAACPDLSTMDVYLAPPAAARDRSKALLLQHGVLPERLQIDKMERF